MVPYGSLPLSFCCAGKTRRCLTAVSCHQLKMLTDPGQQTRNAVLAKSMDRGWMEGIAILLGHSNCPWPPNGRDEPNPFRSASVLPRSVRACSFGALGGNVWGHLSFSASIPASPPSLPRCCPSQRSGDTLTSDRDEPPLTSLGRT